VRRHQHSIYCGVLRLAKLTCVGALAVLRSESVTLPPPYTKPKSLKADPLPLYSTVVLASNWQSLLEVFAGKTLLKRLTKVII
jgi:hypothetical protein